MIIAPIKKKWLDMMLSGEKQEEYREIKSYWDVRLAKELGFMKLGIPREKAIESMKQSMFSGKSYPCYVLYKNGYSSSCARYWLPCSVTIGKGKTEWGAPEDIPVYIFTPLGEFQKVQ